MKKELKEIHNKGCLNYRKNSANTGCICHYFRNQPPKESQPEWKAIDRFGEYWFGKEKLSWKTIELPLKDFIRDFIRQEKEKSRAEVLEKVRNKVIDLRRFNNEGKSFIPYEKIKRFLDSLNQTP